MKNRSSEYNTCPDCGGPKKKTSKHCRQCSYKHYDSPKAYKRICPDCGGPKQPRAMRCRKCKDSVGPTAYARKKLGFKPKNGTDGIDRSLLTDEWLYWFSGFFMGEGSAIIRRRGDGPGFYAALSIKLRQDDYKVIEDISRKLGGHVQFFKPRGNVKPGVGWSVNGVHNVKAICELILKYDVSLAKKSRDVHIVLDYCLWRLTQPRHCPDWSEGETFYQLAKSAKLFKELE